MPAEALAAADLASLAGSIDAAGLMGEELDDPGGTGNMDVDDGADPLKAVPKDPEQLLCVICLANPRAARQTFCSVPCAADVKAAERDAASRSARLRLANGKLGGPVPGSELDLFRKFKKLQPEEFRSAVLAYKTKCAGHGRGAKRPAFDWVRYSMAVELASKMQAGTKCLWLTKDAFIKFMKQTEDLSVVDATLAWERKRASKSSKCDNGGPNGSPRLLVPVEDFVYQFTEKGQHEKVEWGIKDRKNPSDCDIQQLEDVMGTDHHTFDSSFYGMVAGGLDKASEVVASNPFAKASSATPDAEASGVCGYIVSPQKAQGVQNDPLLPGPPSSEKAKRRRTMT
jgi:hypothetical protein